MTDEEIAALPYRPCVGLVVINERGHVFAAQRLDSTYDAWQMPQGGIDEGEEPEAAALRELTEETGILPAAVKVLAVGKTWIPYDLPKDLVPKLWKGRYRGQTQLWYLLRFTGSDDSIDINTETPEFSRWAWMDRGEVLDKIVPFKKATYRAVFDEFEEYF